MKVGPVSLLLGFSVCFQALALPLYRAGNITPDIPFLVLIYLGFLAPIRQLLIVAGITSLVVDLGSLDPVGTRLVGYLPALWLLTRARGGFLSESAFFRGVLTFAACTIAFVLEGLYLAWREGYWLGAGIEVTTALYTTVLGVGVHAALDLYRHRLEWARDRFLS